MKYRKFGTMNFDISVLSFGAYCLPEKGAAIEILRCATDNGVNFLELSYPGDMDKYKHEAEKVGEFLKEEYRDKVKISIDLPLQEVNSPSELDHFLDDILKVMRVENVDFCVVGELNRANLNKLDELNISGWAEKAIGDGKIGKLGFSFHDDPQYLKTIVENYKDWAFCQVRYSFMDVNHHPGITGIKYAARNGLAVVATKPFKDGRLLKNIPEKIIEAWKNLNGSPLEWCLRWVWNHPEVSTVVVDAPIMRQVLDNVALVEKAEPDNLTVMELVAIDKIRELYLQLKPVNCATCYCCMPCPVGIDVPHILEIYNDAVTYNDFEVARAMYKAIRPNIENCTQCGQCESKCPRQIPIIEWLKKAHEALKA